MPEKLTILFITSWYPTRNNPTNGNFIIRHAKAVSVNCKVGVVHVSFDKTLTSRKEIVSFDEENLHHYVLYLRPFLPLVKLTFCFRMFRILWGYFYIYKIFKQQYGKPDIIHANVLFPIGIIAVLYKKVFKIPFLISEHWTGFMQEFSTKISKLRLFVIKRIAHQAEVICPVSEDLRKGMEDHNNINGKYKVVPNVVDTTLFHPKKGKNIKHNKKRILHISSLNDEQKNITGIIHTINNLAKKRNDFEFHFIHDFDAQYYIDIVRGFDLLNPYFFFHGKKSVNEVARFLRECDFFVLFSNYETFSIVTIEALASGIPVIGTNIGALREHISAERGLLVKPRDNNDLLEKIEFMLDHYLDYDEVKMSQYAQNFCEARVTDIFNDLYKEILTKNN